MNIKTILKILICDDDSDIRNLLVDSIENYYPQCFIIQACNGRDGIEQVKVCSQFDLIISDQNMGGPGADGIDLYNYAQKFKPPQKFLMISSEDTNQFKDFIKNNKITVLEKPFLIRDLYRVCDSLITCNSLQSN